jgi:aryl-alcohol dehydrogenase-like predicted oxidoreductase
MSAPPTSRRCAQPPTVSGSPIVGATTVVHVVDAVAAVDVALTDQEVARLEAPYRPHRVIGHS